MSDNEPRQAKWPTPFDRDEHRKAQASSDAQLSLTPLFDPQNTGREILEEANLGEFLLKAKKLPKMGSLCCNLNLGTYC